MGTPRVSHGWCQPEQSRQTGRDWQQPCCGLGARVSFLLFGLSMLFAADSFCDGVDGAHGSGSATQAVQTRLLFAALALLGCVQRFPSASKSDAQAVHGVITTWVCVAITASVLLGQGASADANCSNGSFNCTGCEVGKYSNVSAATSDAPCTDCPPMTFQSLEGQSSCDVCPERMESDAGSELCRCSPGYDGPSNGPCTCEAQSNRFLEVRIDDSLLKDTGWVNVSVYNTSSGNSSDDDICGDGGAGCTPFSVFFTFDGSPPNASSPILCGWADIWREDQCLTSWRKQTPLLIPGAVLLRMVVLRQGYHPDACLPFGSNLTNYHVQGSSRYPGAFVAGQGSPYSASVECNVPSSFSRSYTFTPPVPTVVMIPAASSLVNVMQSCSCKTQFCCYNNTPDKQLQVISGAYTQVDRVGDEVWMQSHGTGKINITLSSSVVLKNLRKIGFLPAQIRFQICEAPAPVFLGETQCEPTGDPVNWPIYSEPLQVSTRSFITVHADYLYEYSPPGLQMRSNAFTFQVPVRNFVQVSPDDGQAVTIGTSIEVRCVDERTDRFLYSFETPLHKADDASGWRTEPLSQIACEAHGRAAKIPWPLSEPATLTVSAVDADGRIVCEERRVTFTTLPYGERSYSNPVCPTAVHEVEKIAKAALIRDEVRPTLHAALFGPDDRAAFLDTLVDVGALGSVNSCTLNSDGTLDCT